VADFGRGIKAGVITGAVYLAISLILVFTLGDYQYLSASGLWEAAGLASVPLGGQIVRGIVFGAIFATLYSSVPRKTSVEKGVVLSSFFWVLTVIEVTYTNLSWPWQTAGIMDGATYYGGTINLSSVNLALISVMSALVFGVLAGFLWSRFRGKESGEERKGRAVLLIGFILGAITWAVVGGTYIRFVVSIGVPFMHVLFFPWSYTILRTLVLFVGLIGWVFALTAWRKTRRGESRFNWGSAGGVMMAVTGFMLLPGALAITGGVFSGRKAAREADTAEATAGGKVVRAGEQKMRTGMKRNLILAIISAIMLAVIVIVRFTMPTPTGNYTSVTLDQYSSTAISRYRLSLTISLNSTTYNSGEQICVNIEEKNILPTENEVHAASNWPVHGLTLTPCGRFYYPFGIAILQGYYGSENVTGATPLEIFDPNVLYTCPAIIAAVSYDFSPWSNSADVYNGYEFMPWSVNMTTRVTSGGFWTGSYPNAIFSNFTPGIYTVAGGDEWGALVILHFTVL
jgi:hypothetical protein